MMVMQLLGDMPDVVDIAPWYSLVTEKAGGCRTFYTPFSFVCETLHLGRKEQYLSTMTAEGRVENILSCYSVFIRSYHPHLVTPITEALRGGLTSVSRSLARAYAWIRYPPAMIALIEHVVERIHATAQAGTDLAEGVAKEIAEKEEMGKSAEYIYDQLSARPGGYVPAEVALL